MSRATATIASILVLWSLSAAPASVSAQATDAERTALARSLFREGVELATEERYPEAVERFRRVRELQPTPGVAYNLAAALERTGSVVEASELLREVLGSEDASPPLQAQARELLEELDGRIAHVTVRTDGPAEGSRLLFDDAPLAPAAVGVAMPVDPGHHTVEARRDEQSVAREEIDVGEGESAEVTLELPPLELAQAAPGPQEPPPPAEPPAEDGGGGLLSSPWLWTGVGLLVVAGVVGGLYLAGTFDAPAPVEGNAMPGVLQWD